MPFTAVVLVRNRLFTNWPPYGWPRSTTKVLLSEEGQTLTKWSDLKTKQVGVGQWSARTVTNLAGGVERVHHALERPLGKCSRAPPTVGVLLGQRQFFASANPREPLLLHCTAGSRAIARALEIKKQWLSLKMWVS